jgi:peptide/nickel transport system permease protein
MSNSDAKNILLAPALVEPSSRSALSGTLRQVVRRPMGAAALAVLCCWTVVAIFARFIEPYGPNREFAAILAGPSGSHLLGTDDLGRDVLSRLVSAAAVSLPVAVAAVLIVVTAGTVLGCVAGYYGRWIDAVVMRTTDVVLSFPAVILALAITAALGPSLENSLLAICAVAWPSYARVTRGLVRTMYISDYVSTSRLLGVRNRTVLLRDIWPNLAPSVLVLATIDIGRMVLLFAALSYLGLGATPPTAEWGSMIADALQYPGAWWLAVPPGLAIGSVVISASLLGDTLRDALDPHSRQGRRGHG